MTLANCPACAIGDLAAEMGAPQATDTTRVLSLPAIHCPACITGVETALSHLQGVSAARVNFSLKRVTIRAATELSDTDILEHLRTKGFEAYPLNLDALESEFDGQGRALLWRMGLSGFAMMNVMLLSVAVWSGAADATRDLFHWISALIALPVTAIAAQPFFASAVKALRAGRMNMDVPIALAIVLTLATSLFETMQGGQHAYFDAALSLTFFLLIGRYLDHRIRRVARSAAKELTALEPATARILTADGIDEIALSKVVKGDVLVVQAGGRLPVDGVLVDGKSLLDLSFITGESEPVASFLGREMPSGTIALTGPLHIRATAVGEDSTLRRLAALVDVAESARGKYRSLSDKAAAAYAPGVHVLSALAFAGWYIATWDLRMATNVAVAVLIITCPCALGLAVPAVATSVTARLFRRGVLLKSATALERMAEVDLVVFDKTGTLTGTSFTRGPMNVEDQAILKALAQASAHPLAKAVADGFWDVDGATLSNIRERAGFGVEAVYDGQRVLMGAGAEFGMAAQTVFKRGFADPLALNFGETPLPGAAQMISRLDALGYEVMLLSGDNQGRVDTQAATLGIKNTCGGQSPEDKAKLVHALAKKGRRVLMLGDGLNDTAALAGAHASIAPSSALEASRNAADAVLLGGDITVVPDVLIEAKRARARMKQNFALASVYNVIAVPIACFGLVTPLIAAIAMSSSSITVILNAVRGTPFATNEVNP
ncbi:MAG: heavy metal translocating P-type ATPase [Aliishimia sp.]